MTPSPATNQRSSFLTVNPSFFLTAYLTGASGDRAFSLVAAWMLVVFVSVLVHECGHAVVARAFGYSPRIVLHGMGGTTFWRGVEQTRRGPHALIALAGPFAGFALGALVLASGQLFDWPVLNNFWNAVYRDALWANFGWGLINLLPIVPLDGGQVLQSVLGGLFGPRASRAAVYFSVVAAGALAVGALVQGWYFAALLAGYFAAANVRTLRPAANANAAPRVDAQPQSPPAVPTVEQACDALARGDDAEAERIAKDLIALAPDAHARSFPATLLARSYLAQGRYRESRAVTETMIEPPGDDYLVGRLLLHDGQLEEGTARMRAAFERAPHEGSGHWLMEALIWQRRMDEVRALATGPAASALGGATLFDACAALFFTGRYEDSLAVAEAMYARWQGTTEAYNAACCLARLGRLDEALAWLARAAEGGWARLGDLDDDEDLSPVRELRGFTAVRARVVANDAARHRAA